MPSGSKKLESDKYLFRQLRGLLKTRNIYMKISLASQILRLISDDSIIKD